MRPLATPGGRSAAAVLLSLSLPLPAALAQRVEAVPEDLREVGLEQQLEARLPADLRFTDERGRSVRLGEYFAGERPVVLTLVYYRCPMLCNLVLDGLVDALREMDWQPGREFEIVTVSIDPLETPQLARVKQQSYIEAYGRPAAASGWHFLTGAADSIRALADRVGFRYQWVDDREEYAHPAALMVVTPDGRISRYLLGIRHDPKTLRLSLVEASEGRIGSVVDQFLLYCYRYDEREGRYAPVALRIMRVGGLATVVVVGLALLAFWRREARMKRPV